jgi:aryl-alcohol dehydrogenase-like predicted oxidoreductase
MKEEKPDFLMIGYSATQQGPAERILPLAADLGVATIAAEPFKAFDDGAFFSMVAGKPLPDWASEFDCESWAQFSLKYILSNPAITSVVTETSKVKHVVDNMRAGYGRLPDEATRQKMSDYLLSL